MLQGDRDLQDFPLRAAERLAEAGVDRVGDSCDDTPAETINGPFKSVVIHRYRPWRSCEAVAFATLEWSDRYKTRRSPEPVGSVPPAETEARDLAQIEVHASAA